MQIRVRTVEDNIYWIDDKDIPKGLNKWSKRKIADYFRDHFGCHTIDEHFYIDKFIYKLAEDYENREVQFEKPLRQQEHDTVKSDWQKFIVEENKRRKAKGLVDKIFSVKDFETFEKEWLDKYIESHPIKNIKPYVPEKRKLYRIKELPDILNMSKTNIYNRIKEGNFPTPQKIGGMSVWKPEVVEAWIEKELSSSYE